MRRCASYALLLALAVGCSRPDGPRPNLVLLVLDTTRPDLCSAYGHDRPTTPFLEELAAQGTLFERAHSTSSWTLPSHASMFTGLLPTEHGATCTTRHIRDGVPALAEKLANAGYETVAFSNNPWVSSSSGLDRGFETFLDLWDPEVRKTYHKPQRHPTATAVEAWLAKREDERPFFAFVNLIEAHLPYRAGWHWAQPFMTRAEYDRGMSDLFPKGAKANELLCRQFGELDPLDEGELALLRKLYEADLRLVDEVARNVITAIDAVSPAEETVLLVVSDHGENLGEHGHVSHNFNLFETCVRVVFIARGPGFPAAAVVREPVQLTDCYPTLLLAAGVDPGARTDTFDLRSTRPPITRRLVATLDYPGFDTFPREILESGVLDKYDYELRAAYDGPWKVIRGSNGIDVLYDLSKDPGERSPVTAAGAIEPARAQRLQEAAQPGPPREGGAEAWRDGKTIDALRKLGYTD